MQMGFLAVQSIFDAQLENGENQQEWSLEGLFTLSPEQWALCLSSGSSVKARQS